MGPAQSGCVLALVRAKALGLSVPISPLLQISLQSHEMCRTGFGCTDGLTESCVPTQSRDPDS
jgi:hypothetical protein